MSAELFKFKLSKDEDAVKDAASQVDADEEQLLMSEATFKELRDTIYELSGIYYTESKQYILEGRIPKRLTARNLSSYEDYLRFLKSPDGREELNSLFEAITINETYFFRAETQFEAFEKLIVPEILSTRASSQNPVLRVWSAACSTGEEPYTIAMLILEKLKPQFPNVSFQILASDLNNSVLESARQGIYKEYAVRNIPHNLLQKYFKQTGAKYFLSKQIKNMVKFMNLNLYDAFAMRTVTTCDVVFCENVLIYFDVASKQKVVSHLYHSLNNGGYLFIGYSESLHGISKAFKLIHLPKAMAYKKE